VSDSSRPHFVTGIVFLALPFSILLPIKTTQPTPERFKEDKAAWVVPVCTQANPDGQWIGTQLKFVLPKGTKPRKVADIDYQEYLVHVSKRVKPLELWWGALVTAPLTREGLLKASVSSDERTILDSTKRERGIDSRGRNSRGEFWRILDIPGVALAKYEGVPGGVKQAFDAIMDSACLDQP
jgi:hypothetical protein